VCFSFLWKFLCGLGSGINSTSSMAIITTHYKKDRERMIGIMQSAAGVGLLMGPFVGAILYQIGGYMLPFIANGNLSISKLI
jgi:MFS family permease